MFGDSWSVAFFGVASAARFLFQIFHYFFQTVAKRVSKVIKYY